MFEPVCALDAAKIRMLVSLMTKDLQPWIKWVERKLGKVARRWEVREAMTAKPNKTQLKELKEDIVESTLKKGGGKERERRHGRDRASGMGSIRIL